MDLNTLLADHYTDDINALQAWCEEQYNVVFSEHFTTVRDLYIKLKSKTRPITDEELEWALTVFPMELFTVSESLNALRLQHEVIKLRNKQLRKQYADSVAEKLSGTARTQSVDAMMIESDMLLSACESVIARVENELTFSREFIMGAKKIWDSRRKAETPPIGEIVPTQEIDLPDYISNDAGNLPPKSYIQ